MNKQEIELQNVQNIIAGMPEEEKKVCLELVDALRQGVGDTVESGAFMMAMSLVLCEVAVKTVASGVSNTEGDNPIFDKVEKNPIYKMIGQGTAFERNTLVGQWCEYEGQKYIRQRFNTADKYGPWTHVPNEEEFEKALAFLLR